MQGIAYEQKSNAWDLYPTILDSIFKTNFIWTSCDLQGNKSSWIYTLDSVGTLISRSKYPLESGSEIGVYLQKTG